MQLNSVCPQLFRAAICCTIGNNEGCQKFALKEHQSKNDYVNTGTHLLKGDEPPMAFSVQILGKKWLCGAEKGFLGAQAPQKQPVQHCATDNGCSLCHNPQPY